MWYSEIIVTLNIDTHLSLEDASDKLKHMRELESARKQLEKARKKSLFKKMFCVI